MDRICTFPGRACLKATTRSQRYTERLVITR